MIIINCTKLFFLFLFLRIKKKNDNDAVNDSLIGVSNYRRLSNWYYIKMGKKERKKEK